MQKVNGVVQLQQLAYSDIEAARIGACLAKRAMFQAQGLAIELGSRENERDIETLVTQTEARIAAEQEAAAKAPNAEVVELRLGGPVAA